MKLNMLKYYQVNCHRFARWIKMVSSAEIGSRTNRTKAKHNYRVRRCGGNVKSSDVCNKGNTRRALINDA